MKRTRLNRPIKKASFSYKLELLKKEVIRNTIYFTFSGLIFYGLVSTTIVPAAQGMYIAAKDGVLTFTSILIPMSNADTLTTDNPARILSPISIATTVSLPDLEKKRTATPTPEPQPDMVAIIKKTFGQYADKALYLLRDRPDICSENESLNPNAINTSGNNPSGSMDIGLFQINNYWNDIGNIELLKDPEVNAAVAWHKFKASGYSFNQWTCGRRLGI